MSVVGKTSAEILLDAARRLDGIDTPNARLARDLIEEAWLSIQLRAIADAKARHTKGPRLRVVPAMVGPEGHA